jgi:hypothetical protein
VYLSALNDTSCVSKELLFVAGGLSALAVEAQHKLPQDTHVLCHPPSAHMLGGLDLVVQKLEFATLSIRGCPLCCCMFMVVLSVVCPQAHSVQ